VRVKAQRERTKRDELKAEGARLARRIPSVDALRHALQGRIARVRVCAAGPETRVRGEAFAARTPALASAVASLDTLEREARRTTVDGLVWWVPALPTQGSEVHVLTGAAALLGVAIVAWQIEVAPRLLRLAGSDPATLYRMMKAHFTHFIDLNVDAAGPRLRSIAHLDGALEYLERGEAPQTDVVVYRTSPG
jgi:hypothetical protein